MVTGQSHLGFVFSWDTLNSLTDTGDDICQRIANTMKQNGNPSFSVLSYRILKFLGIILVTPSSPLHTKTRWAAGTAPVSYPLCLRMPPTSGPVAVSKATTSAPAGDEEDARKLCWGHHEHRISPR